MAIHASAVGVGGPIQMWYVEVDGVHRVGKDTMDEIHNLAGGWQHEQESLFARSFGGELDADTTG